MENLNILVICTGNSCRSQMAEGYLKYFSKQLKINTKVYSAGIRAEGINKKAIEIMAIDGIDISNHTSNTIEEYKNTEISHVITVCDHANESCPVYLKKVNLTHKNFSDPSKFIGNTFEIQNAFEKCREEIKSFTFSFLKKA
jgi:arsenate reductase (thioredoxin)|tara:strand:- start:203 stop:628 length:426 start_codon:yes stop_codon:yes gene_type:complete